MPDSTVNDDLTTLRTRTTRFLSRREKWKIPLRLTMERISESGWEAVIFGGVLRDLLILGNAQVPRDVDIVVNVEDPSQLESAVGDLIQSRTRFGGFRLRPKGWLIDVWTLRDTWALRQNFSKDCTFAGLVQTTFLNVEAVAAEIAITPGYGRRVYSAGFFEAVEARILDINFEPNPYPALCVVRSIVTALRLGFAISHRLATYIVKVAGVVSPRTLMDAQTSHYGNIRVQQERLSEYVRYLDEQLLGPTETRIYLPGSRREQLELSKYWTPVC
jgi:hypothetical protein